MLESYTKAKAESNHLLSIPKIFFLDMCRGNAKVRKTVVFFEKKLPSRSSGGVLVYIFIIYLLLCFNLYVCKYNYNIIETGDGWGTHVQQSTIQFVTSSDYWDGGRVLKIL